MYVISSFADIAPIRNAWHVLIFVVYIKAWLNIIAHLRRWIMGELIVDQGLCVNIFKHLHFRKQFAISTQILRPREHQFIIQMALVI